MPLVPFGCSTVMSRPVGAAVGQAIEPSRVAHHRARPCRGYSNLLRGPTALAIVEERREALRRVTHHAPRRERRGLGLPFGLNDACPALRQLGKQRQAPHPRSLSPSRDMARRLVSNTLRPSRGASRGVPPPAPAPAAVGSARAARGSGRRETAPSPPPGASVVVHAEGGHAPEVVRGTEQRKILRHTNAPSHARASTAVPPLHQVGNLSLDLGADRAIARFP